MNYVTAETLEGLFANTGAIRESPLLVDTHYDAMESLYELRLNTTNRKLAPGTLEVLADLGLGVEYIGDKTDTKGVYVWALLEE